MNFYCDITLLPDAEANLGFLWKKVFQQVHIALAENKVGSHESAIAISITDYGDSQFPLGNKLRLLAENQAQFDALNIERWLNRLKDYCHISSIKAVPEIINEHAFFRRKTLKSNVERLARRRAKRKSETLEQALAHYHDFQEQQSSLPYISIQSLSTSDGEKNHCFPLFIEKLVEQDAKYGSYDCYGLSKTATVPLF